MPCFGNKIKFHFHITTVHKYHFFVYCFTLAIYTYVHTHTHIYIIIYIYTSHCNYNYLLIIRLKKLRKRENKETNNGNSSWKVLCQKKPKRRNHNRQKPTSQQRPHTPRTQKKVMASRSYIPFTFLCCANFFISEYYIIHFRSNNILHVIQYSLQVNFTLHTVSGVLV